MIFIFPSLTCFSFRCYISGVIFFPFRNRWKYFKLIFQHIKADIYYKLATFLLPCKKTAVIQIFISKGVCICVMNSYQKKVWMQMGLVYASMTQPVSQTQPPHLFSFQVMTCAAKDVSSLIRLNSVSCIWKTIKILWMNIFLQHHQDVSCTAIILGELEERDLGKRCMETSIWNADWIICGGICF